MTFSLCPKFRITAWLVHFLRIQLCGYCEILYTVSETLLILFFLANFVGSSLLILFYICYQTTTPPSFLRALCGSFNAFLEPKFLSFIGGCDLWIWSLWSLLIDSVYIYHHLPLVDSLNFLFCIASSYNITEPAKTPNILAFSYFVSTRYA